MKYTTFFPSIVWRFSLLISSILVFIFKSIEYSILDGEILSSILFGILLSISHFLIGFLVGFLPYIFFAKIGNELIKKGKSNFEKKTFLNIYGLFICIVLWILSLIISNSISEPNSFFFPIPFFISMTFAIWYYEIKMEIVAEESVEGILDDNFIIHRK